MGSRWDEIGPSGSAYKPSSSSTSAKKTGQTIINYKTGSTITEPTKVSSSGTTSRNSGGWSGSSSTGSSSSSGSSIGSLVQNGLLAAAGLTGSLGSTSQGSGSWGGTNNGQTIGGTMGSASTAMQYNKEMMEAANAAAAAEAEKNREWQKMMSDTSFQRAVEDMRKAGINPILAAGTQAPMGSGSAAATHMAAGMPENYTYSTQEGSQWGVNSSYSFNNFAEAINGITKALADLISGGAGEKATGKAGQAVRKVAEAAKEGIDFFASAKRIWNSFGKSQKEAEKYIRKTGTY